MRTSVIAFFAFVLSIAVSFGQAGFRVVPLGVKGGGDDGNLSAYLVAPIGSDQYICLDGGTVSHGIRKAIEKGVFKASPEIVLKKYIQGYFISHPHLDHLSGMIINSVDDTVKNLYGFDRCLETIRDHYFNWQSWPNVGSDGNKPALKKYSYHTLIENQSAAVPGTAMSVSPFRLSHGNPYESAAFLVESDGNYLLYLGDTGPDEVEKSDRLSRIWKSVGPLVQQKKLKGIFMEVSYPNEQPDSKLFGHLTPNWFMKELANLGAVSGNQNMKNLNVIVTHIKPTGNNEKTIKEQLKLGNKLGINLIFPEQGSALQLK